VFAEAKALCERDGGRLWGASLCAPIMLVDPQSRRIVASHPDAGGALQARDGVFVGILPADRNVANTAVEWSGTRWTQMLWPLPENAGERATLIAHELFHQRQPALGLAAGGEGENPHLDTLEGRYYLQLEWRALAKALQSDQRADKRAAAADALAFRAERYRRFPNAQGNEAVLELNEGLAEYTGVVVGHPDPVTRQQAALRNLSRLVELDASFVRSFAYATGPAYGLLLDELAPGWRGRLSGPASDMGARLRDAAGIEVQSGVAALAVAAARYDGAALHASENAREEKRLAQLERNRRRFVAGPILTLRLVRMSIQFNPSTLQPLDELGTVYPTLRIADEWGVLEVVGGALMRRDRSAVVLAAPVVGEGTVQRGDGWTLTLKPGWRLVPDVRRGDFKLEQVAR
jgi:hypothetical protein